MRISIHMIATIAAAGLAFTPSSNQAFAHSSPGGTANTVGGLGHLGKACDTQAQEQKPADKDAFMQACISRQATETQGQMNDTQETPTSGSTEQPPTQVLSK